MPVKLMSQLSGTRWVDSLGNPLVGGKLYFFEALPSTTPKTVYTTSARTIAHPHPIILPASGVVPTIWYGAGGNYRFVLTGPDGTLYEEADDVQGEIPDPTVTIPAPDLSAAWPTGSIRTAFTYGPVTGWVRANGLTIGKTGSGATEYMGDDAYALYEKFWYEVPGLVVSTGRGATPTADWNALKTLGLPDTRGIVLAGRDGMGNSLAGRLPLALFPFADSVGAFHGNAYKTLITAELPAHNHTGTIGTTGSTHQHSGNTDAEGAHYHEYWETTYALDAVVAAGTGATVRGSPIGTALATTAAKPPTHQHPFATLAGEGAHIHDVTINNTGSGQAFSLFQPTMLVTNYIKL